MKSNPLILRRLAAATLLAVSLNCQSNDDSQLVQVMQMNLRELLNLSVSTAAKHEQLINKAPSIINIFTRKDIEKMGVTSLIDVLKHAPGIETSMAADGRWRVDIRGVRKAGTILLLIDDQPFNDFYDGSANFDLPLNLVEKVEIIRGPGSALYGTNAVVGVINVTTRQKAKTAYASLLTHNGHHLSFTDRQTSTSLSYGYNIGLESSDGANQTENQDFYDLATENHGRTNRHIEQQFLSAFYNWQKLHLDLIYIDRERGPYVGPLFDFGANTQINKTQTSIRASYQFNFDQKLAITPKLRWDFTDYDGLNEDIVAGSVRLNNLFTNGGFTHETYQTSQLGAEVQLEYKIDETSLLLAGVSFEQQKMSDYSLLRNYQVIGFVPQTSFDNFDQIEFGQTGQSRDITALYLQSEKQWKNLLLTLGLRFDDYSDFGNTINPRAALIYQFNDAINFKFLVADAFRAPTFSELYDNTRIGADGFIGNPNLEPEEISTIELGFEYQSDWIIWRGNFFDNDNRNLIEIFDPQGGGATGRVQNIGDLQTNGVETEVIWQASDEWQLFFNVSQFKANFNWRANSLFDLPRTYLAESGQRELFNTPRTRAKLGVDWSQDNWNLFVSANYGGKASNNNTQPLEGLREVLIDDYLLMDLSLQYQLSPQLTLRLAANNLGSDKNADPDASSNIAQLGFEGLLQPGATFLLSANYQF